MPRIASALKPGQAVFNLYSLRIGRLTETRQVSERLGRYAPAVGIIEISSHGGLRRVRWRLDNCRRFTPKSHRSRQAFLLLARALKVSSRKLWPRLPLWRRGFTRARQREFARLLHRRMGIRVPLRSLHARQTSNQVIGAVLAARRNAP